jgi:hypothetical protein
VALAGSARSRGPARLRGRARLRQQSLAIDSYKAATHGVVADALVELGATRVAGRNPAMLDLRPDTSSYARASYSFELRGDVANARDLMQRALEGRTGPADAAFALEHLAGLAFDNGDLRPRSRMWTMGCAVSRTTRRCCACAAG